MKTDLGIFYKAMFHFFNKLPWSICDILHTTDSKDKSHHPPEELVVHGSRSFAIISKKQVPGARTYLLHRKEGFLHLGQDKAM